MKTTVTFYDFANAFERMRPDNFSREGLIVLFDYLEECEQDTGEEYELDVIAICCDFTEDTIESIAESYSIDVSQCENENERREVVLQYLEDEGVLIGETSIGFVYRNF